MLVLRGQLDLPLPVDVMGLPLRPLTAEELIALLVERAQARRPTTVYYANAHTINLTRRDERYRRTLCGGDVLYADGASVVWASWWSTRRLPRRMTAADFFPRFARRCTETGLALYMLGGRPGIAERAAANLRSELPNLRIVGTHHGYFADGETDHIVTEINAARPDVLLVGLSSPRQEFWLAEHTGRPPGLRPAEQDRPYVADEEHQSRASNGPAKPGDYSPGSVPVGPVPLDAPRGVSRVPTPGAQAAARLDVPVRWCVGALFDYLAGVERRGPAWLCHLGGEWLFRLLVDPVGKWRRYLLGNPLFVWNALRWRFFERGREPGGTARLAGLPNESAAGGQAFAAHQKTVADAVPWRGTECIESAKP